MRGEQAAGSPQVFSSIGGNKRRAGAINSHRQSTNEGELRYGTYHDNGQVQLYQMRCAELHQKDRKKRSESAQGTRRPLRLGVQERPVALPLVRPKGPTQDQGQETFKAETKGPSSAVTRFLQPQKGHTAAPTRFFISCRRHGLTKRLLADRKGLRFRCGR